MKKRYILMAVTAALVFAVAAGGTLAATTVQNGGDPVQAALNMPNLEIDLTGGEPAVMQLDLDDKVIMPGSTYSVTNGDFDDFIVTNTADVDAIVRLTITKYWKATEEVDGQKREVMLPADNVQMNFVPNYQANWLDGTLATDLFASGDSTSEVTPDTLVFYYRTPLDAKYNDGIKDIVDVTESLLSSIEISLEKTGNKFQGAELVIRATADAVQFVDGYDSTNETAINAAWGVTATIDNGVLTNIA